MRHLVLLIAALILAPGAAPAWAQGGDKKQGKPNVLFIFTDDQRADTIAALGNKEIKTPNLDKLVKQGTVFHRAYCMGAMQGAVCTPSRAMVLTGRTLFRVQSNLAKQSTWPEALARFGYTTFMTGKWHNGEASAPRCFQIGKSVFFGGMGDPFQLPVADFQDGKRVLSKGKTAKHSCEQFADEAVAFLRQQKGEKPFMAYVAFNLPHDPRVAPTKYHEYYNANKPSLPANYMPVHPFDNGEMVVRDEKLEAWPRSEKAVRQHLADYYAAIAFLDEQIGRILEALRESGQLDNTIIIFSSDSGLAVGSHGLFGKQNIYDHSMRVPLIIAGPGVPKDKSSNALVYLLDLFPTTCDLVGLAIPAEVEGKSLAPILRGQAATVRDSLFLAYRDVQRGVRDQRWKLIRYPQINKSQLFDLENDPHEMLDLSGDAKHAGKLKEMMALLQQWQRDLGDTQELTVAQPRDPTFTPPPADKKKK